MKKLIFEILNSQYKDWIIFFITIILSVVGGIIKYVKGNINRRKNKKKQLPWIGRIDGIDKKNNHRNIQL